MKRYFSNICRNFSANKLLLIKGYFQVMLWSVVSMLLIIFSIPFLPNPALVKPNYIDRSKLSKSRSCTKSATSYQYKYQNLCNVLAFRHLAVWFVIWFVAVIWLWFRLGILLVWRWFRWGLFPTVDDDGSFYGLFMHFRGHSNLILEFMFAVEIPSLAPLVDKISVLFPFFNSTILVNA